MVAEARLACVRCGAEVAASASHCACGGLAEVLPPVPEVRGAALQELFRARRSGRDPWDRSGVWRYRELVCPALPTSAMVCRGEGNTGLYRSERLRRWVGLEGMVLQDIDPDASAGIVRVESEEWRATTPDGSIVPAGTHVRVVAMRGARMVVEPAD